MKKDTKRRRKRERPVNREESDQDSSSESDDTDLEMREEIKRHDDWLKDYHERHPLGILTVVSVIGTGW